MSQGQSGKAWPGDRLLLGGYSQRLSLPPASPPREKQKAGEVSGWDHSGPGRGEEGVARAQREGGKGRGSAGSLCMTSWAQTCWQLSRTFSNLRIHWDYLLSFSSVRLEAAQGWGL